jgi:uncharacterized protein (UPF0335 family)
MSDAHGVARDQLRAFIERIERLEEEKKTIADDIKDVYGEAKGTGFDTVIMKRVISLRKKDAQQRMEEEAVLDTYLAALGMIEQPDFFHEAPAATREDRAKSRTTEAMADHKTLVDEMADAGLISEEARHENKALADAVATKFGNGPAMALQSPRQAAEAVSERTAFQDERNVEATVEQRSSVLVEADKAEAVAGVLGQPETIPTLTVQHDGVNVGGPERADVTDRRDDHLNSQSAGEISAPFSSLVTREADEVVIAHSEIDPSEDRQEVQSLGGEADANVGGCHVVLNQDAATHQAGALVQVAPAKKPLRPHCRNPGDNCGGYGSTHCSNCLKASKEVEVPA